MNKKFTTLLFIIAGTITVAVLPTTSVFAGELSNAQPPIYQGQQLKYPVQPTSFQQPATYEGQICTKYKYFTVGKVQPNGYILGTYHWVYKIPIKGGYKILPDQVDQGGTEILPNTFGSSFNPGDTFDIDNGQLAAGVTIPYTPQPSNSQLGVVTQNHKI